MRLGMFLSVAFALLVSVWATSAAAAQTALSQGPSIVAMQQAPAAAQQPGGKLDIDIDVNKGSGGGRWYTSPVWIAIGALAVIVILALIVMAGRGGGTTIVRG